MADVRCPSCGGPDNFHEPHCQQERDRLRALNTQLLEALEALVRHGEHDGPCTDESGDPRTPDTYKGEGCLLHVQTSLSRTNQARAAIQEAKKGGSLTP